MGYSCAGRAGLAMSWDSVKDKFVETMGLNYIINWLTFITDREFGMCPRASVVIRGDGHSNYLVDVLVI